MQYIKRSLLVFLLLFLIVSPAIGEEVFLPPIDELPGEEDAPKAPDFSGTTHRSGG